MVPRQQPQLHDGVGGGIDDDGGGVTWRFFVSSFDSGTMTSDGNFQIFENGLFGVALRRRRCRYGSDDGRGRPNVPWFC